ncbi:MAG TPA: TonB-dependent receptor plug domain-containing protein, partial [Longimicrobiales bacterium]|nr:TonB-dependent receptor plug domain-containing protein [Longimicrobiales bacterium]
MDGIPATMPDGQSTLDHLDLTSLGRAEVLRGPASALYGNAAGGVLVLDTDLPEPGPLHPVVRLVTGSDGLLDAGIGLRGWAGRTAVRVDARHLDYAGFRADPSDPGGDGYGSADRELLNAQALTPLAGGSLRLTLNAVALAAENPGSLPRDSLSVDSRPAWGGNVAQGTRKDVDQAQLGAVWTGPVAGGRAEVAAWALGRSVSNPIPPSVIDLDRRAGGFRALWGSEGGSGDAERSRLAFGGGLELDLQRDDRRNFVNDGGSAGALTLDQLERVRGLGGFVRAGLRASERVRVTGALRYDRFR